MSVFTEGDVSSIAAGGNIAHNGIYMARYQTSDCSLPTGSDIGKLREFMKRKYVEKKWYSEEKFLIVIAPTSSSYSGVGGDKDPWGTIRNISQKSNMIIKVLHLQFNNT